MAGTDRTRNSLSGGPRVVLVEPQMGENIGAVARAMLNCGLNRMSLVKPKQGWPNQKAVTMASGATEVLDKAQLFETTEEAVQGITALYATTARPRELTVRVIPPRQAGLEMREADARGEEVGLLFGPERSGLTNDHIVLADNVAAADVGEPDMAALAGAGDAVAAPVRGDPVHHLSRGRLRQ